MKNFAHLTSDELRTLTDAPALITILVGGADGNLDKAELDWAHKLTEIRGYASNELLRDYYDVIHLNFDNRVAELQANLPTEQHEREQSISAQLADINSIMPKVDATVAFRLYESLISFSEHIAKSSGGFLRFAAVSRAEEQVMHLPMITPIAKPADIEANTDQTE